jgi:hypothetical protein
MKGSKPIHLFSIYFVYMCIYVYIDNGNKDLGKWRNIPCPWISGLNIIKMSILLTLIYRFN